MNRQRLIEGGREPHRRKACTASGCDLISCGSTDAGFENVKLRRITTTLVYADANEACDAVFVAGPVALAWSRFSDEVRARARACYLESIDP
jgi:hypothetical protein